MTTIPTWFDSAVYMHGKYNELKAADPAWTVATMNAAFDNAGLTPYAHYEQFGDSEGIAPNALFDQADYLRNKAAAMGGGISVDWLLDTIHAAGMTVAEHYDQFGFREGVNPSDSFDQGKYLQAKLYQVQATAPAFTMADLIAAFERSGFTAVEHYMAFAAAEGLTESAANAAGYSYAEGDTRPVANPNKADGFVYTLAHNSNTVQTITVERVVTEKHADGEIVYTLETKTVDLTQTTNTTEVTITGSQTMDLSDVLALLQGT